MISIWRIVMRIADFSPCGAGCVRYDADGKHLLLLRLRAPLDEPRTVFAKTRDEAVWGGAFSSHGGVMAAEWIKIEEHLPDKPEVIGIAVITGIDHDSVIGKLARVWIWASANCLSDGVVSVTLPSRSKRDKSNGANVTGARLASHIDRVAGLVGFAEAMVHVGWLKVTDSQMVFPKFDVHNSKSAKERALAQQRQQRYRDGLVTQPSRSERDETVTREEKRREEKRTPPSPPSGGSPTRPAKAMPGIPEPLASDPEFVAAWEAWVRHRVEKKAKLTPTAASKALAKLAKLGTSDAVAMLEHSTAQGYTGLYPPNGSVAGRSDSPDDDNRERNLRMFAELEAEERRRKEEQP